MPGVRELLSTYAATGSTVLVLSADSGQTGYDSRPELDEKGWATLLGNLDRIAAVAGEHGVKAVLHPHVGTMVENPDDVRRVLDGSSIALCLDTGHLLIGGTDPAELARQVPDRIAHTHIKDVDARKAKQVQSGRLSYTDAVRDGMYRPVGQGDVDFARSSRACAAATTTAGTCWSRTRSSPRSPAARARWPTSTPAWSTCGGS